MALWIRECFMWTILVPRLLVGLFIRGLNVLLVIGEKDYVGGWILGRLFMLNMRYLQPMSYMPQILLMDEADLPLWRRGSVKTSSSCCCTAGIESDRR